MKNNKDKLNEIGKRMNIKNFHPFISPDKEVGLDDCIEGSINLLESLEKDELEAIENLDRIS